MDWLRSSPVGTEIGVLIAVSMLFASALVIRLNVSKEYVAASQAFLQWSVVCVVMGIIFLLCGITVQANGGG